MMKAYIQTDKRGNFYNVNGYIAHEGFSLLGWETFIYHQIEEIEDKSPEIVVVGGIGNVRNRLKAIGIVTNGIELDYPEELIPYLGRKIWTSALENIFQTPEAWNVFVKPKHETKKFVGKVVREFKDFLGIVDLDNPTEVWCSEIVHFKTEWRCFVRYGEILDIRQYKGNWDSKLDLAVIKNAINDFKSAPAAYALDFGVDENDSMKLVEVNDGHSLGTYGLSSINYAKLISARWAELTNTRDYNHF